MANFNCRILGILLNEKEDAVLLVKRNDSYLPGSNEFIGWEFCGGGIEHGETPEQALRREYQEELGLNISVGVPLNNRTGSRDGQPLLNLTYLCKYDSGEVILTTEHTAFKWVPIRELKQYDLGQHLNQDRDFFLKNKK